MSHLINPILLANYEDNDSYEETSCTLKHWPDLWPEEAAAEAGVYRERMQMRELQYFLAKDHTQRVLRHCRNYDVEDEGRHQSIINIALVSLADEAGWEEIPVSRELQFFGGISHKTYRIR